MSTEYIDNLVEAQFATTPWASQEEIELYGKKVYTSNSLKENVKKVSKKYLPKIASLVIDLIDSKKLIPVFLTKNIKNYLLTRRKYKYHQLGATYEDKIYIFLDQFYSVLKLSSINEKELARIIVHELVHLADHTHRNQFLRINYKIYLQFYKEFFSQYLTIDTKDMPDKIISDLLKRIYSSEKKGVINFVKVYAPLFTDLEKYSSLSQTESHELFDKLIDCLDSMYEAFSKTVPSEIWDAGRLAYMEIAGGKNPTLSQEFWAPGEIICILSEINPNHPNVVKSIGLIK